MQPLIISHLTSKQLPIEGASDILPFRCRCTAPARPLLDTRTNSVDAFVRLENTKERKKVRVMSVMWCSSFFICWLGVLVAKVSSEVTGVHRRDFWHNFGEMRVWGSKNILSANQTALHVKLFIVLFYSILLLLSGRLLLCAQGQNKSLHKVLLLQRWLSRIFERFSVSVTHAHFWV